LSEVVRQNITGFIAQQGNIEAHVEALSHVILNEEKARMLGETGRELVATEYSASAWRQRYRECIVRAMS
jgi:glycosyltransferase involved in cell wall biosynthesis